MTHVAFDSDKIGWGDYLRQQQIGEGKILAGREEIQPDYFEGTRYMRGYGIRDALSSVGRFLLPIASNIMESAKGEATQTLGRIGADVVQGKPILETVREQGKTGLKNVGTKMQQCGKGRISRARPLNNRKRKRDYLDL